MARIIEEGVTVASSLPWYQTTDILCPSCGTRFRLTHEDTAPGNVGPIQSANLWLGWRQVTEGIMPTTSAIDWNNLHVDPAQIYGPCPKCGYNPVVVYSPNYGGTKNTSLPLPILSDPLVYMGTGYTSVLFVRGQDDKIYALIMNGVTNAPRYVDTQQSIVYAITRADDGTLITNATFNINAPHTDMRAEEVQQADAPLVTALRNIGFKFLS